jgi:hypothetical protein
MQACVDQFDRGQRTVFMYGVRPSMYGETSLDEWISTSSVLTTAQPPSAFTPRIAA